MRSFLHLSRTELKLFLRDPLATVFALLFPLTMMLLLAAVFGDADPQDRMNGELVFRGVSGDDYYVAASVGIVAAALGLLVIPVTLAGYRERGVLRRFRASGLTTPALFGAHALVALCISLVGSLLMVAVATAVYSTMLPEDLPGVVVAYLLSLLCFVSIGFLLAGLIPTPRAAQGVGLILFFAVWMISGSAPPHAVLPDAVRDVAAFEPLTHVVIAIQDPWFGFGWNLGKLAILAAVTVVAATLATWRFRWM